MGEASPRDTLRIVVLGNSGSGKTTLARWLAQHGGARLLDFDTVAWEPGQIAVARDPAQAQADVRAFCAAERRWVVEGCYGSLARAALSPDVRLLFLDPGPEACLANCRARPWEPHKYASPAEQDARLAFLLEWVRDYYGREGEMGYADHQACFDAHPGPRHRVTRLPVLEPPSAEVLGWLHGEASCAHGEVSCR